MPRTARKRSASGYYHVISKGIAGQTLFGDDADRKEYLKLLGEAKTGTGIKLHAYCLMSNHVHLAIEDPGNKLAEAMKYADERYGSYYANKIGRRDGIFRKPFWSEPIGNDAQLLCTVRYVHANPALAGMCKASAYPWSSVGDYLGRPTADGIADTEVVLDLLDGRAGFIEWSRASRSTAHPFAGSQLRGHLTEDERIRVATDIVGHDPRKGSTVEEARLLVERGLTERQVERLTGITRYQMRNK